MAGSRVVVCGDGADVGEVARQAALRASACVLVVRPGDVDRALAASLLPRGRVLGTDDPAAVATAVAHDSGALLDVVLGGADGPRRLAVSLRGAA